MFTVTAAVKLGDSIQKGLDSFFAFVPNLLAFFAILVIGWIIAKAVRSVVNKALDKLGVDAKLHSSPAGEYVDKVSPGATPSHLIGAVAYWFIFLFALSAAIGALKIAALTDFIAQVQAYLPNIIVAIIIFVVAAALAGAVAGAAQKLMGDTPTGKVVTAVVPGLILAIAMFMVLNQLKIAEEIVTITYAAILGMLSLAGALAFGLGGRDIAGRMLNDAYDAGQRNRGQFKQDMQQGQHRARQQAEQQKARIDDSIESDGSGGPTSNPASSLPRAEEVDSWEGRDAYGLDAEKIGEIAAIYLDEDSGQPAWAAVKAGVFGGKPSFAPLAGARANGDRIHLAYDKAKIKDAPKVDPDSELSPTDVAGLYGYYGLR